MAFHKVNSSKLDEIKSASLAFQLKLFKKLKIKQLISSLNIHFNQNCKRFNVIPSIVKLKTCVQNNQSLKALHVAQKVWINEEISFWFKCRDSYSSYLKFLHSELSHKLHTLELDSFIDSVYSAASPILFNKRQIQMKKLNVLINNKNKNTNIAVNKQSRIVSNPAQQSQSLTSAPRVQFYNRIVNLSSTNFNKNELNVLNKGFKHCHNNISYNVLNYFIADVDLGSSNTAYKYVCLQ